MTPNFSYTLKDSLKAGLLQAWLLTVVGAIPGAVVGWSIFGSQTSAIPEQAGMLYTSLFILMPITLILLTLVNLRVNRAAYVTIVRAFSLLGIAGFVGSVGGSAAFLTAAMNIPAIFGRKDAVAINQALWAQISLRNLATTIVLTTVVALILAIWAYSQTKASEISKDES